MTGKITNVEVQTGNQINLTVVYSDKDTGFERTNVFTIPAYEVEKVATEEGLNNLILSQGKEYKVVQETKTAFDAFINQEFEI